MTNESKFLLIGGGVASALAAHALRREGETGKIVILSTEEFLPYVRFHLSKAFLLKKRTPEELFIFNSSYFQQHNIQIILNTKALAVDTKSKIVKTDHAGNIHFEKLFIATGCSPKKIDIPGAGLPGVHYLRTIKDAEALIKDMQEAKKAIIYGNSFITLELASTLSKKGIKVTVVTKKFHIGNFKLSSEIAYFLDKNGIQMILGESITKIHGNNRVQSVETSTGKTFAGDFIIVDMGLKPNIDFLNGSGIDIDIDDGIVVNQYMQTNIPDIYAAGDVVKFFDPVFKKFRNTPYSDTAVKQGKIAALNMLGAKHHNRTASYLFFHAFGTSIVILGDATDTRERLIRGSLEELNFAYLSLKNDMLHGAIFVGRPITEIKAAESLINNHVNLKSLKQKIVDISFPLEPLANQILLTLQGGGALGAFECGVVKAMEESGIYPNIVAGISIGAFNSAIIAANPEHGGEALEAFWNELSSDTPEAFNEQTRRILSSLQTIIWGSAKFFHPRWLIPMIDPGGELAINWTSFYDSTPIKKLLCKYVDFKKLKTSPIRLLVMAVNIETAEFETFDSYTDDLTPDHILASGSLPPGFPWTTINGKHYWDGGIVTNTPLDSALEICGSTSKKIFIVDLYPKMRCLPKNMIEVLARRDEILFNEKIRKDLRTRDLIDNYKKLVEVILTYCEPDIVKEIIGLPIFIQTMGDLGVLSVTRIIREIEEDGLYSWDSDFSRKTIEELKLKGYEAAKKIFEQKSFSIPEAFHF